METLILIFLVIALACFVIAAISLWKPRVNLIALGLAFWVATILLPHLK
jgi:hypothetical protein